MCLCAVLLSMGFMPEIKIYIHTYILLSQTGHIDHRLVTVSSPFRSVAHFSVAHFFPVAIFSVA